LRSDHTGPYGYAKATTPALDAFRRDSILFQRAFSHCPMTLPSHTTLFTGEVPPVSGVRDNLGYRVSQTAAYLPQILKDNGYATGAAVSTFVLRRATGIARGFDFYDDAMEGTVQEDLTFAERNGDKTREAFERWLSGVSGPVFGFLHIYEPHCSLSPARRVQARQSLRRRSRVCRCDHRPLHRRAEEARTLRPRADRAHVRSRRRSRRAW
jgi:arylsulfatase A-like enzyme